MTGNKSIPFSEKTNELRKTVFSSVWKNIVKVTYSFIMNTKFKREYILPF